MILLSILISIYEYMKYMKPGPQNMNDPKRISWGKGHLETLRKRIKEYEEPLKQMDEDESK